MRGASRTHLRQKWRPSEAAIGETERSANIVPETGQRRLSAKSARSRAERSRISNRVDKSLLALPEPRRLRDKNHRKFVSKQPCLICGRQPSDAHHLRFAQHRALGRKVSDEFIVPLCRCHHREVHRSGDETSWWREGRYRSHQPRPSATARDASAADSLITYRFFRTFRNDGFFIE